MRDPKILTFFIYKEHSDYRTRDIGSAFWRFYASLAFCLNEKTMNGVNKGAVRSEASERKRESRKLVI